MLTTIQELEHEIDQFHKNIKDSNELMKILISVASLTKTQTESFGVRTKALQDEMDKLPPELSNLFQKKIEEFVQEVRDEYQSYQTVFAKLMDGYADKFAQAESSAIESIQAVPGQIKDNAGQQYCAFLKELEKIMDARLAQLSDTEKHIVDLSQQLEEKYTAFVAKLEATNMEHMYKYCQDMNKSINTKLGLALGGVVIAVIVSVISLFI